MNNPSVNRYLKDKSFDRIDHALGRPVDPMQPSYRNYFSASEGTIAEEFRASPFWTERNALGQSYFSVTQKGREALRNHLKAIGDKHRTYIVAWDGIEATKVATSHSKARYAAYLNAADVDPDLTFKTFQAVASVRLAGSTAP